MITPQRIADKPIDVSHIQYGAVPSVFHRHRGDPRGHLPIAIDAGVTFGVGAQITVDQCQLIDGNEHRALVAG